MVFEKRCGHLATLQKYYNNHQLNLPKVFMKLNIKSVEFRCTGGLNKLVSLTDGLTSIY